MTDMLLVNSATLEECVIKFLLHSGAGTVELFFTHCWISNNIEENVRKK